MRLLGFLLFSLLNATAYEGAGIQLFKQNEVLLVQGARSGRWGFPKGHREPFDTRWRDTAVREVREETGFEENIHYEVCDGVVRHWGTRLYWTGHVIHDRIPVINTTEHRAVEWVSLGKIDELRVTRDIEEWALDGMPIAC